MKNNVNTLKTSTIEFGLTALKILAVRGKGKCGKAPAPGVRWGQQQGSGSKYFPALCTPLPTKPEDPLAKHHTKHSIHTA